MTDFFEGTLSEELIRNYRDDLDFQNLIDLLQKVSSTIHFSARIFPAVLGDWQIQVRLALTLYQYNYMANAYVNFKAEKSLNLPDMRGCGGGRGGGGSMTG